MKGLGVIIGFSLFSVVYGGSNPTPNYYKCEHKVGGSWDYGRVPNGCDVDPFGDPNYVKSTFSPIIFDDFKTRSVEKGRYIDSMVPLIRDASTYYLSQRKPTASEAEKEAWGNAVLAVTHQETFMTHYRLATDSRIKMIRGDYGHGHGMMQVDDRWHFAEINEGKGWQIFENITYALDIFYDGWQKAGSASCVKNLYDRSRAAYSVYNGGSSKVCRWTNPNDTWAKNDKNYKAKLDAKEWEKWVSDLNAPSVLNVGCFMEGNEVCGAVEISDNMLLKTPLNGYCVASEGVLSCVEKEKDGVCLTNKLGLNITTSTVSISQEQVDEYTLKSYTRAVCQEAISDSYGVGEAIVPQKDITLRDTPGGSAIGAVKEGVLYQVLDFEIRNDANAYRYYKVKSSDGVGYIYAGKNSDATTWVQKGEYALLEDVIIPQRGDVIKIVPASGINLRKSAGGELLLNVPQNSEVVVEDTLISGDIDKVYYKVSFGGVTGYIYGGQLEKDTLQNWAVYVKKAPEGSFESSLSSSLESSSSSSSVVESSSSQEAISSSIASASSSSSVSNVTCNEGEIYSEIDKKCMAILSESNTTTEDSSLIDSLYTTVSNLLDNASFESFYLLIDYDALYDIFSRFFGDLYDYITEYSVVYLEDNSTQIDVVTDVPEDGITF